MAPKEIKKEKDHLESTTDKVGEIAVQYGFTIIKPPHISSDDVSRGKHFKDLDHYNDVEEKIALTRWYMEQRMDLESQPLAIHYKKPLAGSNLKKKPTVEMYGFEVMGSTKATSEALLLRCALAVLDDLGYKDVYVDINTIGDRESILRFERELQVHFRKHGNTLPAKLRQEFKKNHYSVLKNPGEEVKEFLQNAPQPVGSLSEIARLHFKEVLESVEMFNVAYKIKSNAISNKLYASYTVFEIRKSPESGSEEGELLAYGYRYNSLAKKIGGKREVPTVGVTLIVKKSPELSKKIPVKSIKKPKFYLVQLGGTAKLKSLNVVEMLRKHKIPVHHSITKDKITGQLNGAEYMKSTHVLIMGQKEAIENTMVVRNIANREQETVAIDELCNFLKNLNSQKKSKTRA
jgi:histidyl-tRNA synthetase